MRLKKIMLLFVIAIGLTTLMSTQCETEDPIPECNGIATATATGNVEQSFCFDDVTTYNYDPATYISFWARESTTDLGFDMSISATNGQNITPGTYNCGPDEPGFVELILEDLANGDSEFYKSQSGTITLTEASDSRFKATFNVVAVGYFNGETINFSGTVDK